MVVGTNQIFSRAVEMSVQPRVKVHATVESAGGQGVFPNSWRIHHVF